MCYFEKNLSIDIGANPKRTTISMGIGKRKVSTATHSIPILRVFENSMDRMAPVIRAAINCCVIFSLL